MEIIKYLIETCNVDTEARTYEGWTVLHCATRNGHLEIVTHLVENRLVDKTAKDYDGRTALDMARTIWNEHSELVKYLTALKIDKREVKSK